MRGASWSSLGACTVAGKLVQLLMLAGWAAGMFCLFVLFGFANYCEHSCRSVLENPLTGLILSVAVAADVIVTWWIVFTIPQAWALPRRVVPR